jgi:hypothetical protein
MMIQKSSLPENLRSVSMVLTSDKVEFIGPPVSLADERRRLGG